MSRNSFDGSPATLSRLFLGRFCLSRSNLRHQNVANIVPVRNEFWEQLANP